MAGKAPWTEDPRLTPVRKTAVGGVLLDMIDGFRLHRTGRNAALVAHYGFLSAFPLMLVLTTVLGFLLQGDSQLRADIVDSALANLPIVGQQLETEPERLKGNVVALVLGLLLSLWAGTKAFIAVHTAIDDTWEVPLDERDAFPIARAKAVGGIAIVGGAQVITAFITSVAGYGHIAAFSRVLLMAASIAVNSLILTAASLLLASRRPQWRLILPGCIAAGVVFSALQLVGTSVVARAIKNASPVYGTFASVIALLSWLSLHATVALLATELNAARARRRRRPA